MLPPSLEKFPKATIRQVNSVKTTTKFEIDDQTLKTIETMLKHSIPDYDIKHSEEAGYLHAAKKLEARNNGLFLLWNKNDPNRFFYESLNYFINDKNLLITPSPPIYDSNGWSSIEIPYKVSIKKNTKTKTIDFNMLNRQLEEKTLHRIAKKLFTKYYVSEIATANNSQFKYLEKLANYYHLEATELATAIKEAKKKETEQAKMKAATKKTIELWHEGVYFERTFIKSKGKN